MIEIGEFSKYRGYAGTIVRNPSSQMYSGKVQEICVEYYAPTLDKLYDNFKTVVDLHLKNDNPPMKVLINSDGYYPMCPNCYQEIETGYSRKERPRFCECGQELIWKF